MADDRDVHPIEKQHDHKAVLAIYGVPSFVLARVGVVKRT